MVKFYSKREQNGNRSINKSVVIGEQGCGYGRGHRGSNADGNTKLIKNKRRHQKKK